MRRFPEPDFSAPVIPPTAVEAATVAKLAARVDGDAVCGIAATPRVAAFVTMVLAERRLAEAEVFPLAAHALRRR